MTIMSYSEVRNHLKNVLDEVTKDADYTIVTRRDSVNGLLQWVNGNSSFT